jgi:hypothetical protein
MFRFPRILHRKHSREMTSEYCGCHFALLSSCVLPRLLKLTKAGFVFTDESTKLRVINLFAIIVIIQRAFRMFL